MRYEDFFNVISKCNPQTINGESQRGSINYDCKESLRDVRRQRRWIILPDKVCVGFRGFGFEGSGNLGYGLSRIRVGNRAINVMG